jgi:hypothetical protein
MLYTTCILPTECFIIFMWFSEQTVITFLNSINQSIFVMDMGCVLMLELSF